MVSRLMKLAKEHEKRVLEPFGLDRAQPGELAENLVLAVHRGERRGLGWALGRRLRDELRDRVRTLNMGHHFTQGTADSNEVWVDFQVWAGKRLIARSELRVFDCGHLFLLTRTEASVAAIREFLDRPDG